MTTVTHFFILAGLVATVQGGSQALSRALFSRLIPAHKTSEFFGFYAVCRTVCDRARSARLHAERRDHRVEPDRDPVHHRRSL